MTVNQSDLRVRRTRRLLKEAMVALVLKQPYEAITIRALTDRADVGYKTFFRHYEGKEGLLYDVLSDLFKEASRQLFPPTAETDLRETVETAFHFAAEHSELLLVLFRSPAADRVMQWMVDYWEGHARQLVRRRDLPTDLVAFHGVSAGLNLVRWWLVHEQPYDPATMADYVERLLIEPTQRPDGPAH